ncbi:hypothetical protein KCU62_g254, partial [Aureobasidium sp. EXF-3399]
MTTSQLCIRFCGILQRIGRVDDGLDLALSHPSSKLHQIIAICSEQSVNLHRLASATAQEGRERTCREDPQVYRRRLLAVEDFVCTQLLAEFDGGC